MPKYTSDQLSNFLNLSLERLQQALSDDPNLIKERGDYEETLLHQAASKYWYMGPNFAGPILDVLFNTPGADFSIKDDNGNTAVHVAALATESHKTNYYFVFSAFVKKASETDFDFSTLNNRGLTVLHLATITTHEFPWGNVSSEAVVLEHAKNPAVNALSTSGSTALFYAINHSNLVAAENLLNSGADPTKFGAPNRDPFGALEALLQNANEALIEQPDDVERIEGVIAGLTSLKQKMLLRAEECSVAEIRKNARVLAQAARGTTSVFAKKHVPPEILTKIAAHTRGIQTQFEAEKTAMTHLFKPKTTPKNDVSDLSAAVDLDEKKSGPQ